MSEPAIAVEGVGKRYYLGELHTNLLSERIGNLMRGRKGERKELWALRDVSFSLQEGEVLGVIGRNGAGKSTLLKVLSRITAPTLGRAMIRGRLASLLEVGTGFHPELTGRENIFLNGTILGMKRKEIARKFDQIVAFSEVEAFLDTPIKRYSSGMYVRLAFAVAAHLEPDVLVVDEVLAVGDREFQEKCLGRMNSIARQEGRTVLFVSHNIDAISRICTTGLYLRNGQIAHKGKIDETIATYLAGGGNYGSGIDLADHTERWGNGRVRITHLELREADGPPIPTLRSGGDFDLVMTYSPTTDGNDISGVIGGIGMNDVRGVTVFHVASDQPQQFLTLSGKGGQVICRLRDFNLVSGRYSITLFLGHRTGEAVDCLNDAQTIEVVGGDFFGTGHPGYPAHCKTLFRSNWSAT
jgi:lipopolysaccharide transport system ATP-binding protein